jgi:guanylate kinase
MESEEIIRRRLDTARKEIENYPNYDYILVNDQLEPSTDGLVAIVQGERARRSGKAPSPNDKEYLTASEKYLKANMEDKIRSILDSFDVSSPTAMRTQR